MEKNPTMIPARVTGSALFGLTAAYKKVEVLRSVLVDTGAIPKWFVPRFPSESFTNTLHNT